MRFCILLMTGGVCSEIIAELEDVDRQLDNDEFDKILKNQPEGGTINKNELSSGGKVNETAGNHSGRISDISEGFGSERGRSTGNSGDLSSWNSTIPSDEGHPRQHRRWDSSYSSSKKPLDLGSQSSTGEKTLGGKKTDGRRYEEALRKQQHKGGPQREGSVKDKKRLTFKFDCNIMEREGGMIMKSFDILLGSINDIKAFVNIVNKYEFDVDLTSGRYVVDAKSIMGIFSLDLSKVIKVDIHSDSESADKFIEEIKPYIQ